MTESAVPGMEEMLAAVDVADPYPLWQSLLEAGPLVMPDGSFALLTRHQDIDEVLRSPVVSSDRANSTRWGQTIAELPAETKALLERRKAFLFMDPPDHTRLRRLVSKAFTPRVVEGLRPLVEQLSRELIDQVVGSGSIELIEDLAYPLPVRVISEMLGVPPEDHVRFASWSQVLARSLDDTLSLPDPEVAAERLRSVEEFRAYFLDLAEKRRAEPRDDLFSALVAAEDDGDRLTTDELLSTAMLLLVAGHETTVSLIANGMLALLREPGLHERLAAEPDLAPGVVEEVLRLDPPVQMTMRIPLEDLPVPGGVVTKGGVVVLVIAAAGRDPEQHPEPLRFDPRRETSHHAFSAGPHFCLGAPLARLEAAVVLRDLARRLRQPELQELTYRDNRVLRGPATLRLACAEVLPA